MKNLSKKQLADMAGAKSWMFFGYLLALELLVDAGSRPHMIIECAQAATLCCAFVAFCHLLKRYWDEWE